MHRQITAAITAALAALVALAAPASAEDRHLNYAAVGDSITDGFGTSDWVRDGDGWRRVAWRYSYPEQADVRPLAMGNSCVSDECSVAVSRWLPAKLAALPRKPKTLISNFGVNDIGQGITADQLIARSLKFRRDMKTLGYRVVFSTIVPPPVNSPAAYIQPQRLLFNDWVRSQPTYIDYAKTLQCQQWLCPGLTDTGDMHVNDAGAARMAAALEAWIDRDAG